jgi:hypothetical protein
VVAYWESEEWDQFTARCEKEKVDELPVDFFGF